MMTAQKQATTDALPRLVLLAELEGHVDRTWGLAWNPVEPVLASCGADKNVRLHRYRFVSGAGAGAAFQTQTTLDTGHGRTVRALTWTPDGMVLATASFDSTIGVWEPVQEYEEGGEDAHAAAGLGEWECVGTLEGHDSEVKGVAFSYDGTLLASCSRDKSVWVWETQPDSEFECLSVLMEHSQDVKAVAWHPREELLASASYDDTIKLYADDPSDDWFVVQTLQGHTSTVWSIAFSPDGAFLASASDDRTVRIWRRLTEHQAQLQGLPATKRWQCTNVLRGWHTRPILSISWSNTSTGAKDRGLIASTGSDGNIVVYQVTEAEDLSKSVVPTVTAIARMPAAHGLSDVNCVTWAPNVTANRKKAAGLAGRLEDDNEVNSAASTGAPVSTALAPGTGALHTSDMLATCADDGSVKVWVLPASPLAPLVAVDPQKEASGAIDPSAEPVAQAEVVSNLT